MNCIQYLASTRYSKQIKHFKQIEGICDVCGRKSKFKKLLVINEELKEQWNINDKIQNEFSARESMNCMHCDCSLRLRTLAKAIMLVYKSKASSFREAVNDGVFDDKIIAEINSCGKLHNYLAKIRNIVYSEYESTDKKVRTEDLQKLSYKDEYFDLVLDSDTLEHVPDYYVALNEIYRVLKPGGYHIFTIPMILSRQSIKRLNNEGRNLPASFHGSGEPGNLVQTEFGIDFMDVLYDKKFKTRLFFASPFHKNEVNYVLVSQKL